MLSRLFSFRAFCLGLFTVTLAFSSSAFANNVTVGCAGASGVFDFNTLQSALDSLHAISNRNHQITVSGTCTEAATVSDFENLRLIGTTGATLADPGPNAPGDPNTVLAIIESKNVLVQNLKLQGTGRSGRTLSIVASSNTVNFDQCIFDNGNTAIFVNAGSTVSVTQSTIQNNGAGARVSQSVMTIGSPGGGASPSFVQNNGNGLQVDENAQLDVYSTTTIQNNSGVGVLVTGGRLRLCCAGDIQILNNLRGISVNYGSVDMIGPVLIQGNTLSGLFLVGSQASLGGGQTIQQNGTGGRLGSGGIIARGNSHLDLFNSVVSNNQGSGVVVRDNSSARIINDTVSGNSGGGVTLLILSSAAISSAINGNSGVDLSCSPDSFAYGDDSQIGRKFCSRFSVEPLEGSNP